MGDRSNQDAVTSKVQAPKNTRIEQGVRDRLDKLEQAKKGKYAKEANLIRRFWEQIPDNHKAQYADKIKAAKDAALAAFAASVNERLKSAQKANKPSRFEKVSEGFKRMTPTSAAKGLAEGAKGAAKGTKGAINYVGRKAPDVLMASIVIPNLLMAIGGPIALIAGAAALLSYGAYKAGNAINHARAKYSSDTTNLDDSEMAEKSFEEAFSETFPETKGNPGPEAKGEGDKPGLKAKGEGDKPGSEATGNPGPEPKSGDNASSGIEVTASSSSSSP